MLILPRLNLQLWTPNVLIQWNNYNNEKCRDWDRPMKEEPRKKKDVVRRNWERIILHSHASSFSQWRSLWGKGEEGESEKEIWRGKQKSYWWGNEPIDLDSYLEARKDEKIDSSQEPPERMQLWQHLGFLFFKYIEYSIFLQVFCCCCFGVPLYRRLPHGLSALWVKTPGRVTKFVRNSKLKGTLGH